MKRLIKIGCLWAAVTAVPVLALTNSASAQYRLNYDGKANEANNRIGSGGNNPNKDPQAVSGNDIVTGNVTAGQSFRGNLPYRNSREFRGPTSGGMIDDFIKGSSSVDTGAAGSSYKVETFYGGSRTVAAPPGFTQAPITTGNGAFAPAVPSTVNRAVGDQRIGAVNLATPEMAIPTPGTLLLPGPVDPTAGQQYIQATPLTGIRQVGAADLTVGGNMGERTDTQYNPVTSGRLNPTQIEAMQKELSDTTDPTGGTSTAGQGASLIKQATPINSNPAAKPLDQAQPINNAIVPGAAGATDQGVRQRLLVPVPPPQKQSALYAELLKRHEQSVADRKMSDEQAAREFNAAREQAMKSGALPGAPGQPGAAPAPGAAPGAVPGAGPAVPPPSGTAVSGTGEPDYVKKNEERLKQFQESQRPGARKKPEPIKTQSFATGVKAKGLADLLKNAEDLMKDGKFTAALDRYDEAERVTPNNPLIKLARANAELGATYYARAEAHLREVFSSNPELLSGQYDLTSILGELRLGVLVKDLKDISKKEDREPRAVFLLSYIAYNTGHEENAGAYLDLAEKRSGGKDPLFKLLRENWSIPDKAPATDMKAPAIPEKAAAPDKNK